MASKVFYGTCITAADVEEKSVDIINPEVLTEEVPFAEGDLLVVYFAAGNETDAPSIVIHGEDTEQQPSTTTDSGKFIKTHNITADVAGAWGAGETVIFCYTQQDTNQTYYWELINAVHSTEDIYGVTKLFGNENTDLSEWLSQDYPTDWTTALTPGMLKKLFEALVGPQPEEEDPDPEDTPTLLGLKWEPHDTAAEQEDLGVLSLTNDTAGVVITYPITSTVSQIVHQLVPESIEYTGQLINNGNGGGEGHETDVSDPFITKFVPDDLYFIDDAELYYTPVPGSTDGAVSYITFGDDGLTLGDLYHPTVINGNTISLGGPIVTPTAINNTLTVTGAITGQSTAAATEFIEGGVSLIDKYSPKLEVETRTTETINIAANSRAGTVSEAHLYLTVDDKVGFKPIGIVGFNINFTDSTHTDDPNRCFLWEAHLMTRVVDGVSRQQIEYSLRNTRNSEVNVRVIFNVLYEKIL